MDTWLGVIVTSASLLVGGLPHWVVQFGRYRIDGFPAKLKDRRGGAETTCKRPRTPDRIRPRTALLLAWSGQDPLAVPLRRPSRG